MDNRDKPFIGDIADEAIADIEAEYQRIKDQESQAQGFAKGGIVPFAPSAKINPSVTKQLNTAQAEWEEYQKAYQDWKKNVYDPYITKYDKYKKAVEEYNAGPRTSPYAGPEAPTLGSPNPLAPGLDKERMDKMDQAAFDEYVKQEQAKLKQVGEEAVASRAARQSALNVFANPEAFNLSMPELFAEGGDVRSEETVEERLARYQRDIETAKERARLIQSEEPIDPYRLADFLTRYRNEGITDPQSSRQLLDAMKASGSLPTVTIEDIQFPQYREGEDKVYIPIDRPDIPNVHANYSHELFHALAKRAKDEAGKYAFPSPGFFTADEEDRRYRDNVAKFFERVDQSKLGEVDPEVPKWLEEYRTDPNELMAFGMAHTSQPRSKLTDVGGMLNPHVDPSMGTEARMLMDMYQRQMQRKGAQGFAEGGDVADPEAAMIAGARDDAVQPKDMTFPQFVMKYPLAAAEVGTTVLSSIPAAIASPLYGVYKQIEAGELGQQTGTGEKAAAELMEKMTYQPKSEAAQDLMRLAGKAMDVAKVPAVMPEAMPLAYMATQPGMARRALADFQEYNQRLTAAGAPVPGASYAVRPQMPVTLLDEQGNPAKTVPITPVSVGKKGLKQYLKIDDSSPQPIYDVSFEDSQINMRDLPDVDRWVLTGVEEAYEAADGRIKGKAMQDWWLTTGYNYATQRMGTVGDPLRSLIAGGNIATKTTKEQVVSPVQMQSLGVIRDRPLKDKEGKVQLDEKGEPIRVPVQTASGAFAYKFPEEWEIFVKRFDDKMYPNSRLYLLDKNPAHIDERGNLTLSGRNYRQSLENDISEQYVKEKGLDEGEVTGLDLKVIPEPRFKSNKFGGYYTADQVRNMINLEQALVNGWAKAVENPVLEGLPLEEYRVSPVLERLGLDKSSNEQRLIAAKSLTNDLHQNLNMVRNNSDLSVNTWGEYFAIANKSTNTDPFKEKVVGLINDLSKVTGLNKELLLQADPKTFYDLKELLMEKVLYGRMEFPETLDLSLGDADTAPPAIKNALLKNLMEQVATKVNLPEIGPAYQLPDWFYNAIGVSRENKFVDSAVELKGAKATNGAYAIPESKLTDISKQISGALNNGEIIFDPGMNSPVARYPRSVVAGFDTARINEYLATKTTPEEIKNTSIDEVLQGTFGALAKKEAADKVANAIKAGKRVKSEVFDSGMSTLKTYGDEAGEHAGKRWERFDEPEQTELDGAFLGQCIGGYCSAEGRRSIKQGDTLLYRLRDKRGYPLTNVEVKVRTNDRGDKNVNVTQIKSDGRKTGNVAAKSSDPVIYDFLRNVLPKEIGIPAGVIQYIDPNTMRSTKIELTESLIPGDLTAAYKRKSSGLRWEDGMVYAYDLDIPNNKLIDSTGLAKGGMVERSDTSGRRYL